MGIYGTCEKCGGNTYNYRCLNCIDKERLELERQNGEFEKLVRYLADSLYKTGKNLGLAGDERGKPLMVFATNVHRQCQIIKGEPPLPAAGEKL